MNAIIIAALGIYMLLVGMSGNASKLTETMMQDAPGFVPWAISIGFLVVINEIPATQKLTAPLMTLVLITFVVKNYDNLKKQYDAVMGNTTNTGGASATF